MKKTLIFLGAPGSGKGTQSAKLVNDGYAHISTGNLLRAEIEKKSDLGNKITEVMKSGNLVSDDIVCELLKSNLDLKNSIYIFDGYPRNIEQAESLDGILGDTEYLAVYLNLDTDKLISRLANRRMTKDGKNIYNLDTKPPVVEGICDITGEDLIQREDDKESVVRDRMGVFSDTISPVLRHYEKLNKLVTIQADQDMDSVYSEIVRKIK